MGRVIPMSPAIPWTSKAGEGGPIQPDSPQRSAARGQSTSPQVLVTGIKVIDLICPFLKGGKDRRVRGPAWARRSSLWNSSTHAKLHGGISMFAGVGERTAKATTFIMKWPSGCH